jgi:AbrB family looped-hinge helix DNA binding protein
MGTPVGSVVEGKALLNDDGHIVIPAAIREAMGIKAGETLVMEVDKGQLRVESFDARLARFQDELLELAGPERLLSDELIAERRAEAWCEQVKTDREREAMQEQRRKAS